MDKKGINIEYRDYSLDRQGPNRSAVFRPAQRRHRFSLLQTLLLLVLSVAASGTALATPLSSANILGNFSGATFYNQSSRLPKSLPNGFGTLNVYGGTSGNAINIDNGGNAYIGGTTGATINFNGGGKYLTSAPGSTLSDFQTPLNKLSQSLAALSATASLPKPTNNETLTASPGSNGIAVFNLTSADLSKIPTSASISMARQRLSSM